MSIMRMHLTAERGTLAEVSDARLTPAAGDAETLDYLKLAILSTTSLKPFLP